MTFADEQHRLVCLVAVSENPGRRCPEEIYRPPLSESSYTALDASARLSARFGSESDSRCSYACCVRFFWRRRSASSSSVASVSSSAAGSAGLPSRLAIRTERSAADFVARAHSSGESIDLTAQTHADQVPAWSGDLVPPARPASWVVVTARAGSAAGQSAVRLRGAIPGHRGRRTRGSRWRRGPRPRRREAAVDAASTPIRLVIAYSIYTDSHAPYPSHAGSGTGCRIPPRCSRYDPNQVRRDAVDSSLGQCLVNGTD